MHKRIIVFSMAVLFILAITNSCKHKPFPAPEPGVDTATWGGFPAEVGRIFLTKCATAGCHNQASYTGAGNLLMDTWAHLFDGGSNGAAVIPYSTKFSPMLYFINTSANDNTDPIAAPTMPNNGTPLSKDEYNTITNWIANGAPDRNGNVPFASNAAGRQKIYMTLQGCDQLGVIDAEKKVLMRIIQIGKADAIESSHSIHTSPDGQYAYVCFSQGSYMQKISTLNDSVVGEINLGQASWNAFHISNDGSTIAVTDLVNGTFVIFNANTMSNKKVFAGAFKTLHGVAANINSDTFFVTCQNGNTIYRIAKDGDSKMISIDGNPPALASGPNTPDPHEVAMLPDYTKYLVTCQKTNQVRIMDAYADTLIKVIPVGKFPQEIILSKTKPYAFISCTEDSSYVSSSWKGSVYVINYNTLEIVKRIDGNFYQPHGIAIDDRNGMFYVISRNFSITGPAPHHSSSCGGRNGYYQVYDLNSLQPLSGRRYEVIPDPYFGEARFKN